MVNFFALSESSIKLPSGSFTDRDMELYGHSFDRTSAGSTYADVLDFSDLPSPASGRASWKTLLTPVTGSRQKVGIVRENVHRAAIEARLTRLSLLTRAAGDPFNEKSAQRLKAFCDKVAADRKPGVFPLLNGNLRAIWENELQEQIAIEFFSDGKMQHVLFRHEDGELIETMGTELSERGMSDLVDTLGLDHLWFNGGQ